MNLAAAMFLVALLVGIVAGVSAFQPALPTAGSWPAVRVLGTSLSPGPAAPKRQTFTSPHLFGNMFGGNSNEVCCSRYCCFSCD